jgi:hypothetical protein
MGRSLESTAARTAVRAETLGHDIIHADPFMRDRPASTRAAGFGRLVGNLADGTQRSTQDGSPRQDAEEKLQANEHNHGCGNLPQNASLITRYGIFDNRCTPHPVATPSVLHPEAEFSFSQETHKVARAAKAGAARDACTFLAFPSYHDRSALQPNSGPFVAR